MRKPGWMIACVLTLFAWGCGPAPETQLMGVWSNQIYVENGSTDTFAFVDFDSDGTMKLSTLPPFGTVSGNDYDGTYEVIDETQLIVTVDEESRLWTYQLDGDNLVLDVPGEGTILMVLEVRHYKLVDDALHATGVQEQIEEATELALQAINNAEQMTIDALRIASDVQSWAMKPEQFGGMASTETIADATFEKIKHAPHPGVLKTATYRLEPTSHCRTAPTIPSQKPITLYVNAHDAPTNVKVCVGIAGKASADFGYVVE